MLKCIIRKLLGHPHQKVTTTPIAKGSNKIYRVTEQWKQSNLSNKLGQQ